MWPGPYGEWGSRKYLLASLDQSPRADGRSTTSTSSTATASTRRRRSRRRWARSTTAVRSGQGAVRRDLLLLGGADRGGGGDPARAGHAAAHPPAVVLHAQPLDRGRPARHPRARSASAASRSRRWPRACSPTSTSTACRRARARARASRSSPDLLTDETLAHVRALNEHRRRARPVAGPDGAGLGAARPAGHLGADRGEQRRAAGGQPRRARQPRPSRPTSWPRSTGTPSRRASTCGRPPAGTEGVSDSGSVRHALVLRR